MRLLYHQQSFDLLAILPRVSPERLERIAAFEAEHGLRLPAAMREWYSLEGCTELLTRMTVIGHTAIDLAEAHLYQRAYSPEFSVREPFPVLFENQGIWHIAVNLLESDNPRVYLRYCEDGEPWRLHAASFSDWIHALAWDYAILVQRSGQYFFIETDEQWNQYLPGNNTMGPETYVGNAVFRGGRFLRVMRDGIRLLIIAPERDHNDDSLNEFDIASQADLPGPPQESDWTIFTELAVQYGKIAVSDPAFYRDLPSPPMFDLPSGTYSVAVRVMTYPDDQRVSRLRVLGDVPAAIGARIGDVTVDFAQVGVFDPILLNQVSVHMSEEQSRKIVDEIKLIGMTGVVRFGKNEAAMAIVKSGFGDGRYPIYELVHQGSRAGIEIVFIGPELLTEAVPEQ